MSEIILIGVSCIASAFFGAYVRGIFKIKRSSGEVEPSESHNESFDPLSILRDNEHLKNNLKRKEESHMKSLEGYKKQLEILQNSERFYKSKLDLLQKAAREKNHAFIIYELQRLNYEDENRPMAYLSGVSISALSSSVFTGFDYSYSSTKGSYGRNVSG